MFTKPAANDATWHSLALRHCLNHLVSFCPSILRPSLLILDEAFDGLDKSSRVELASMLESFFDESPRALATWLQKPVLRGLEKRLWDGDGS